MNITKPESLKSLLIMTPEYPPHNIGGGGVAMKNLAHALVERGIKVEVISAFYKAKSMSELPQVIQDGPINVHFVPMIPNYLNLSLFTTRTPLTSISLKYVQSFLNKNTFDFCVCMGGFEPVSVQFASAATSVGLHYIVDVQGFPVSSQYPWYINVLFGIYKKFVLSPYLHRSAKIVVTSGHMLTEYDPVVIPNGIWLKEFESPTVTEIDALKKEYGIAINEKVIVSVGRLHAQKGFQNVIPVVNERNNCKYIIVGTDDGYKNELSRIAGPNIIFAGGKKHEEIVKVMAMADLIVVPSLVEGFGIVGLEAMASRKPVIANPVGGLLQFMKHNHNALLVHTEDKNALSDAIQMLLQKTEFSHKLADQAFKDAGRYSWEQIAKSMEDLINKELQWKNRQS